MNKHVESMRNALLNYQKTAKELYAKAEENSRIFKPAEAEKANEAIYARLKESRSAAMAAVNQARENGKAEAEAWGKIDGHKLTPDAELLSAGAVNPSQFKEMVQKYQDNSTMLQLLKNYASTKNGQDYSGFMAGWGYGGKGAAPSEHYDTSGIPTVAQKTKQIDSYADSAADLLTRLGDNGHGFGTGADSPLVVNALEHFGEDATF